MEVPLAGYTLPSARKVATTLLSPPPPPPTIFHVRFTMPFASNVLRVCDKLEY